MENLFVKAEGPSQPTTPAGTTPSVLSKDVDISTGKEAGGAENNTIDRAEAKYNKLKSEYKKETHWLITNQNINFQLLLKHLKNM